MGVFKRILTYYLPSLSGQWRIWFDVGKFVRICCFGFFFKSDLSTDLLIYKSFVAYES